MGWVLDAVDEMKIKVSVFKNYYNGVDDMARE